MNTDLLHDRMAITDVTVEYCWALDQREFQRLRKVFLPDAVFTIGTKANVGIEAIIARCSGALGPLDDSQHLISSHQIVVTGDRATSRCYLQAQHVRRDTDGGPNFIIAGRYEDDLVRTADGWRIEKRTLTTMWVEGNAKVVQPNR